jgi:hypothetical protein
MHAFDLSCTKAVGNLNLEIDHLEDPGVDRRILLNGSSGSGT